MYCINDNYYRINQFIDGIAINIITSALTRRRIFIITRHVHDNTEKINYKNLNVENTSILIYAGESFDAPKVKDAYIRKVMARHSSTLPRVMKLGRK